MVTIRAFEASDYPDVLAIDEAEQRAYRGALWEAASEAERAAFLMTSEGHIAEYVGRGICLVADRDATVVGFLFALPLLPEVLYVDALAVAPEARRAGVASNLYRALKEGARSQGVRRIHALITPDNDASIGLHQAAGFRLRDRKEAVLEL